MLEDRVVLLQKGIREIIRMLALNEDLSFILPVGRYMNREGETVGRFSINLVLDKLGVKVCDDDDPLNNNCVIKDEIVFSKGYHLAKPNNSRYKNLISKQEHPQEVLKVKRGRPLKNQEFQKVKSSESVPSPSQSENSSNGIMLSDSSSLKRRCSDSTSSDDESLIATSLPLNSTQELTEYLQNSNSPKRFHVDDFRQDAKYKNDLTSSNQTITESNRNYFENMHPLSEPTSSTHFMNPFSEASYEAPKMDRMHPLNSTLDGEQFVFVTESPLEEHQMHTHGLLESMSMHQLSYLDQEAKSLSNNSLSPGISRGIATFPSFPGHFPQTDFTNDLG